MSFGIKYLCALDSSVSAAKLSQEVRQKVVLNAIMM